MKLLSKGRTGKLVVEFSRQSIAATCVRNGIKRRGKVVVRNDENKLDFTDIEGLALRLSSTIRVLNARPPYVATICMPRNLACIHTLELPHVDRRDLVSAVTLEMEAIYGEEAGQYTWDFVYLEANDTTPAYAVVFCVPKRIFDSLRVALNQSQIAVERITLSELGYGRSSSAYSGLVHMVALRQNRLDVMICCRGVLVQSQTLTVSPDSSCSFDQILGTLRRLHVSLPETLQTLVPKSVLLLAQSDAADEFAGPSEFQSSLVAACRTHDFAIEEYSLHELLDFDRPANQVIDLAHPRKPTSPPMSRRNKATILMALVILGAVIFWVMNQLESARLSAQIQDKQQRISETEKKLGALSDQLESAALLNQWDESNTDWSEQIAAISQQFAQADDCYIVRLQMDSPSYLERKPLTHIEGRAKTTEKILQLTRKLSAENPALSVQPNGVQPNSVDPEFSSQFRIEIAEATGGEN